MKNVLNIIKMSNVTYKIIINNNLTYENIPIFIENILSKIKKCDKLIIDLINFKSINATVIGALISLYTKYKCKIKITNANLAIKKSIGLTKLHKIHFIEIT